MGDGIESEILRVLAHERRRKILRTLRGCQEVTLSGFTSGQSTDRQSLAVELHHVHLPMLVDAGVVEYGDTRSVVTRGDRFDLADQCLTALEDAATGSTG